MIHLTRKLRRYGGRDPGDAVGDNFTLPTRDDFHPIDTHEQEEIVRSFEKNHEQMSFSWRVIFSSLLLCFAAFLFYSMVQQTWWPWELRYHSYFMDEVASTNLVYAECIAILACLMATTGMLNHNPMIRQQRVMYSCYASVLPAVFWLYHMSRMPRFRWDVVWLPLGPVGGALICLYVDHLIADSLEELRKLRTCMYSYKLS